MDDKYKERLMYLRMTMHSFFERKYRILDKYDQMTDRDVGGVAEMVPVSTEVDNMYDAIYEEAYKKGMEDAIYAMAKR